jgi:glycerol-3-phosphate acyltransferase PlsY
MLLAAGVVAYVIGSVPTGVIVARLHGSVDLTREGSQRTGATNVLRTVGVWAGIIVLLADFLKGLIAVSLAQYVGLAPFGVGLAGFMAVFGHTRSIFLGGRGGRGVATGLGGLAGTVPLLFFAVIAAGIGVSAATRFVSLGSICGALIAAVGGLAGVAVGRIDGQLLAYLILAPLFIIGAHSDNIARLRAGTERRLGSGES